MIIGRQFISKPRRVVYVYCTVGHGSEWLPGATHPKNDPPPYYSSKICYIGGILAK